MPSYGSGGDGWHWSAREFDEELRQVVSAEGPFERAREGFVVALEGEEPVLHGGERGEIVGRQYLPLHDREVDLDLIEPTGMHGALHEDEIGILLLQTRDGAGAAMGGAVVDDSKHPPRVAVGRGGHDLRDQAIERGDARGRFTEDCSK